MRVIIPGVEPQAGGLTGPINRYRWAITGGQVGSGVMTYYSGIDSSGLQAWVTSTATLINGAWGSGAGGGLPSGITLTPDGAVDQLDPATGQLLGSTGITPPSAIVGGASGNYAAPSGFCITWLTGGVVNGHRVRGRSFFVPIASAKFDTDGTLNTAYLLSIRSAAQAYITGSNIPAVWHRPKNKTGGEFHAINGFEVNDRVAELTSRR